MNSIALAAPRRGKRNIIPWEYAPLRKRLLAWLAVGIIIRLALMPGSFHIDLLLEAYRSHLLPFHHTISWDFGFNLVPKVVYGITLWLAQPLYGDHERFLLDDLYRSPQLSESELTEVWRQIAYTPGIHLFVFLLKLPHLLADLGCSLLVLHLCKSRPRAGLWSFVYWMLNPISLYSAFIYGRHDILGVLILLSSFLLLKHQHSAAATIISFISLLARLYLVVFVPFFIYAWIFGSQQRRVIRLAAFVVLSAALFGFTMAAAQGLHLFENVHGQFLVNAKIPILGPDELYLFVATYTILLLSVMSLDSSIYDKTVVGTSSAALLMTAFAFLHPAYYVLISPFIALRLADGSPSRVLVAHATMTLGIFGRFLFWDTWVTTFLFAALTPLDVFRSPGPSTLIAEMMPVPVFVGLCRSILTGSSIFLLGDLWYSALRSRAGCLKQTHI